MTTWCRVELDNVTGYGVVEGDEVIAVDGSPFGGHKRTWGHGSSAVSACCATSWWRRGDAK
jgi:hypothetical protein